MSCSVIPRNHRGAGGHKEGLVSPGVAVHGMFERIAPTYDIVNRILSFGRDASWRRKLAEAVETDRKIDLLDVATGTGEILVSILRRRPNVQKAVGIDICENMLALCRRKIAARPFSRRTCLRRADAARTGLAGGAFDVATMAFGIRNVADPLGVLNEIHRLLRPGGAVLVLEFSLPSGRIGRTLYLAYLRRLVPLVGAVISRDRTAYGYLNRTIESFARNCDLPGLLRQAGFQNIRSSPLTGGIVTLYQARKPTPRQ